MDKQQRARIKRIRQAIFRARQIVNGEWAKRFEACRLLTNQPRYTGDGSEAFDGVGMGIWHDNAMRAAVGPAYDALKELMEEEDATEAT